MARHSHGVPVKCPPTLSASDLIRCPPAWGFLSNLDVPASCRHPLPPCPPPDQASGPPRGPCQWPRAPRALAAQRPSVSVTGHARPRHTTMALTRRPPPFPAARNRRAGPRTPTAHPTVAALSRAGPRPGSSTRCLRTETPHRKAREQTLQLPLKHTQRPRFPEEAASRGGLGRSGCRSQKRSERGHGPLPGVQLGPSGCGPAQTGGVPVR